MVKLSKAMEKILDVAEERDKDIIESLKSKSDVGDVFLSIIAPYVGVRITPSKTRSASVGIYEEFGIETAIEYIKEQCPNPKRLFLLINSPGGFISSSYKVARALRKNFDDIIVFVPHIAASGGTLIALIGNKIVMGMMSQLSPLDPHDEDGVSALNIKRGFTFLTDYFQKTPQKDAPYTYIAMADKYDAFEYDQCMADLELMIEYVTEILKDAKYSDEDNKIRKMATKLVMGFYTHDDVINLDKAQEIGLNAVDEKEFKQLYEPLRQLLGNYLMQSADKHIIRYWIHKPEEKGA